MLDSTSDQIISEIGSLINCELCCQICQLMLLKCGHMVCNQCIKKLSGRTSTFKCPFCREEINTSRCPPTTIDTVAEIQNLVVRKGSCKSIGTQTETAESRDAASNTTASNSYTQQHQSRSISLVDSPTFYKLKRGDKAADVIQFPLSPLFICKFWSMEEHTRWKFNIPFLTDMDRSDQKRPLELCFEELRWQDDSRKLIKVFVANFYGSTHLFFVRR